MIVETALRRQQLRWPESPPTTFVSCALFWLVEMVNRIVSKTVFDFGIGGIRRGFKV